VKVVIYRNIKGIFEALNFKWWKSFASLLGFTVDEHETMNTTTITVYRGERSACFTIYRSGLEHLLCLDYLRLESEDPSFVKLFDSLIHHMSLSGEKHIIDGSLRESTYFKEGKVINSDHGDSPSRFELHLLRESIFGHVHLALDELVEAQRSGDTERVKKIKETFNHYQKQLSQLNE
jgi:hypothetical protein